MIIKKVETIEEANTCDLLLTKLIQDEKKYNDNLKEEYIVKDYFKNIYNKDDRALFVALDKKVVGYIYVKIITSNDGPTKYREALIDGLYVEETYQSMGIGTSLINKAIEWCQDKDITYISLHVLDKNIDARRLYKKLGFETFYLDLRKKVKNETV